MDSPSPQPDSARQTIVTVALAGMAAAFFLALFVLISGGLLIYFVGAVCAIAAFGGFHYLLWGRLLTRETAAESEEEQLRQQALAEDERREAD
jgi:hypothetical protein